MILSSAGPNDQAQNEASEDSIAAEEAEDEVRQKLNFHFSKFLNLQNYYFFSFRRRPQGTRPAELHRESIPTMCLVIGRFVFP